MAASCSSRISTSENCLTDQDQASTQLKEKAKPPAMLRLWFLVGADRKVAADSILAALSSIQAKISDRNPRPTPSNRDLAQGGVLPESLASQRPFLAAFSRYERAGSRAVRPGNGGKPGRGGIRLRISLEKELHINRICCRSTLLTAQASLKSRCGIEYARTLLWSSYFRQRDHLSGSPKSFKGLCSSTLRLSRFSQRLHFAADRPKHLI